MGGARSGQVGSTADPLACYSLGVIPDQGSQCPAPPAVADGETIAVVAPAGPVPLDRLRAGLTRLEERFTVRVADDIGRKQGFLAGSDERRAEEFNAALRDPQVRGIWVARGGYGCSRIVPLLDGAALKADPKPIVGFSDATVLLCWARGLGVGSIHGPVVTQLGELGVADAQWALDMISQTHSEVFASGLDTALTAEGPLVGGNLSLLAHLCGTSLSLDLSGALCVLEDIGERPYALDRYLGQLLDQSSPYGLGDAAAVLLGDFTDGQEPEKQRDVISTLRARLALGGIQHISGLPSGHGIRNKSFPFGGLARLERGALCLL